MDQENPTGHAHGTSDKDTKRSPSQVAPSKGAAKANPPQPPQGYEITCNTKRDWVDYVRFVLEGVGLGFLILYTIYTVKMYCANRDAADAAKDAAVSAHQALVSNRSWIKVELKEPWKNVMTAEQRQQALKKMDALVFPLTVTNIGNLPALEIRIQAKSEALNRSQPAMFQYGGGTAVTTDNLIFPKDSTEAPSKVMDEHSYPDPIPFTKELREQLVNGDKYLVIYGQVRYQDEFGEHYTQFCNWLAFRDQKDIIYPGPTCVDYNKTWDTPKQ